MPRCGGPTRRAVSRPVCANEKNPVFSVGRKLLDTSKRASHPARPVPAVAPHGPRCSADACRSAIGRPILLPVAGAVREGFRGHDKAQNARGPAEPAPADQGHAAAGTLNWPARIAFEAACRSAISQPILCSTVTFLRSPRWTSWSIRGPNARHRHVRPRGVGDRRQQDREQVAQADARFGFHPDFS